MASPTKTWVDITNAEIDSDSATKAGGVLTSLRDNNVHLMEVLVDDKSYSGPLPHDHRTDGTGGTALLIPSPNLLGSATFDVVGDSRWTTGGGWEGSPLGGSSYQRVKAVNGHAYQQLGFSANGRQCFQPAGAPMVLSLWVRATASLSTGNLRFGLSNGGTTSFVSGHRGQIAYSDLKLGWQRFYMILDGTTGALRLPGHATDYGTDIRFLMHLNVVFSDFIDVTAYMLTIGTTLQRFMWIHPENIELNWDWIPKDAGIPLFGEAGSMNDAVLVTPS